MRDSTDDGERYTRLALIAAAAIVYGLFLGSFSAAAVWSSVSSLAIVASITLILMPFALAAAQRALRERGVSARLVASLAALQVLPFLFLPPRVEVVAPALLILLQGHLLLRSNDTRLAVGSAILGPLFVLSEMALAPARIWLFGFGISVVLALVATLFVNARANRRWVRRRLRRGTNAVIDDWKRPVDGERDTPLIRIGATRTTLYGVVVGLLLLLLLPFLYLPLLLLPEPMLGSVAAADDFPQIEPIPEASTGGPRVRQDAQETFQQIFPGDVNFGGDATTLLRELVMEVTPVPEHSGADPVSRGPLYLRGMVLDTVLDHGVAVSGATEPVALADGDDGRQDGWVELSAVRTATFELDVRQQPVRVRDGSWCVLFGPHPLVGISLPAVRFDPEGLLVDPVGDDEWLSYRIRVGERPPVPTRTRRDADRRYLQLPRDSRELAAIRDLGRKIVRGAGDDRERVARVLAYFHSNFEYSLKSTEFPGLRGVVDFLGRRSGHCTYYASASTLILRSLGIPARIATGFLASDWEDDHYVVTTQNGHAWIEVAFEGVGWMPFDPTPAESRAAAFAALDGEGTRGIGELAGELYYDFERWIATGDEGYMEDFAAAALEIPGALWTSLTRSPRTTLLVLAAVLSLLGWRILRSRRPASVARAPRRTRAETDLYGHLLRALERHGFRKSAAQTPREFAHTVVASGSGVFADVVPWTERFYRARFGGEAFAVDETGALKRYVAELLRAEALRRRDR